MSRLLWLSVALVLTRCATGSGDVRRETLRFEATRPLPAGWKRLQTADYELLTDLDEGQAQRAAQLLSQSMLGLGAMFGHAKPRFDHRLVVIALTDGLEFERRFGKLLWGFTAPGPRETTVCLYGAPDRWFSRGANFVNATDSVLQHELAHAVLSGYFARQPTWFAEGMAQYLETFRWLDGETVLVGEPSAKASCNAHRGEVRTRRGAHGATAPTRRADEAPVVAVGGSPHGKEAGGSHLWPPPAPVQSLTLQTTGFNAPLPPVTGFFAGDCSFCSSFATITAARPPASPPPTAMSGTSFTPC